MSTCPVLLYGGPVRCAVLHVDSRTIAHRVLVPYPGQQYGPIATLYPDAMPDSIPGPIDLFRDPVTHRIYLIAFPHEDREIPPRRLSLAVHRSPIDPIDHSILTMRRREPAHPVIA